MVMTRPPAYHPGNFLMKNMNPTNSGLKISIHNCYTHEKTLLCITSPVFYTGIHLIYMCYTCM